MIKHCTNLCTLLLLLGFATYTGGSQRFRPRAPFSSYVIPHFPRLSDSKGAFQIMRDVMQIKILLFLITVCQVYTVLTLRPARQ